MASGIGSITSEAARACELAENPDGSIAAALMRSAKRVYRLLDDYETYIHNMASPPSSGIEFIIRETKNMDWINFSQITSSTYLETGMLTGNEEAQLLRMLVSMSGATRVLEIGMFTGCAALAMAEVLPHHGAVVTCDINPALEKFVRNLVDKTPHGKKIDIRIAPALETLKSLSDDGCQFDFIFLDADKCNYKNYFKSIMDNDLLASGGTICVDNTLLNGNVYLPEQERNSKDVGGNHIAEFNEIIAQDDTLYRVLIPLRDGITLIRRKADTDGSPAL